MQKRGFHPAFGRRRTPCRREKKNQESPLKSMAATENIPLPHNGDNTCATLLRRCRCSKTACAFGAAAPAAIFAGV